MPHSSGGGHSSSGGHSSGGGHSSSHSSSHHSSSYSSSDYSSEPSYRTSKTYFAGSHRYGYSDKHHNIHYVYSDRDLVQTNATTKAKVSNILLVALVIVPMSIIVLIAAIKMISYGLSVYYPKTEAKYMYGALPDYMVKDTVGCVTDTDELTESLETFYNSVGIPVCVATIDWNDYKGSYSRLSDLAMAYYTRLYSDEKHFVFVYAVNGKYTWEYEAVQGYDTDEVITEANFKKFQKDFESYMNSTNDFGTSLSTALNNASEYMSVGTVEVDDTFVGLYIVILTFLGIPDLMFILGAVDTAQKHKKKYFNADNSDYPESTTVKEAATIPVDSNPNIYADGTPVDTSEKSGYYDEHYGVPKDLL